MTAAHAKRARSRDARAIRHRAGRRWAATLAALLTPACSDGPARDSPDAATAPDAAPEIDAAPDATPLPPAQDVRLADVVADAPGHGDASLAINGVHGAGRNSGSADVFSFGYSTVPPIDNYLTLTWSNGRLQNGPGADLVIFENPFLIAGGGSFMDLIIVEVSIDGVEFRELAHDYTATDPTIYQPIPALWSGFAGKTPVLLNITTNPVDPFDAAAAGGDPFDLDTVVGDDPLARNIRAHGVRFVRVVSAASRIDPHTGQRYVKDAASNGPDLDGVYGRYVAPL